MDGPALTEPEKKAARAFRVAQRGWLDARNGAEPPDLVVSVYIRHYRHDCAARGGRSVGLEMREHYVLSPYYHSCDCGEVCCVAGASLKECWNCGPVPLVPAGRFAFLYTEGRCQACGLAARSRTGRLVDPAERPPSSRAVLRG